jgi:dihydroorotate dehydrogenase (NAD+) catalytic subunit
MQPKLAINIGKLKLKNPVMVASGTFGYAEEFRDLLDLKQLGAIVIKTITLKPRQGNQPPRTCETPAGMLNSIGLENPGIEGFIRDKLPPLLKIGIPIVVSISSENNPEEFIPLAKRLDKINKIAAIELNISCPNISRTRLISQDREATYNLVKKVRKFTPKTLITKLSPNVTDITEIAKAAKDAGTDAISLVNTFYGMSIDVNTQKPKLGSAIGGLSGPAIKPMALRMVWEVYKKVKIPIVGMGGIINAQDALEFIIAGATAVSIGTANFVNPKLSMEVIKGLKDYLIKNKIKDINSLRGSLKA